MKGRSRPKITWLGCMFIAILYAAPQACILPISNAQAEEDRISCFIIGIVNPAHNPFTVYFDKDPLFRYSMDLRRRAKADCRYYRS